MTESAAIDVPVIQLRPLRDRKVAKREYDRIVASIKAVGLVEPLVVFPENGDYVILDGVQRYRALVELGVEVAPCIMGKQREAFTGNRMVNRVSPVQEHRMIEKALDEVDESVIAAALGGWVDLGLSRLVDVLMAVPALILTLLRIGNPRRQRRERALGIDQRLTFQRVAWERRAFAHLVGSKLGALLGEQRSTRPKQQCRRQPHPCRRADRRVLRYGGSSAKAVQSPFPSCA